MRLSDFAAYRDGERWSRTLTSTTSTVFLADVTSRVGPDNLGSNGFGMEDVAASFRLPDLEITLLRPKQPEDGWVSGLLVATANADLASGEWRPLPNWDGSPVRFCLDSGVAVIAAGEAFDDVLQIRDNASSFDLAESVSRGQSPVSEHDRVYFNADVNCYDCWVLGEPGRHEALYVDLDAG